VCKAGYSLWEVMDNIGYWRREPWRAVMYEVSREAALRGLERAGGERLERAGGVSGLVSRCWPRHGPWSREEAGEQSVMVLVAVLVQVLTVVMMAKLVSFYGVCGGVDERHLWVVFPPVFVVVFPLMVVFVESQKVENLSYEDMFRDFVAPPMCSAFLVMCAASMSLLVPVFVFVAVFAAEIVAVLPAMR